ncbi:MAG: prepilin-type N-terminal cleavage/methylation domain-containing protein [Desulfurivibrio sp.]|nr:MAG: prepilin-type N-terminal cleavage/methylation domain-containing protein [Desulfurivibrio sp.]
MRQRVENSQGGFTLVELLITMLLSGIVIISIYSAFQAQQTSYVVQDQVTEMQQNIRAGIDTMTKEMRFAGYDPQRTADAAIVSAAATSMNFTLDLNRDGDVADANENITYSLDTVDLELERNNQPLAQNIEGLEFVYLDEDNAVTADADEIRSVVISILARAGQADRAFVNSKGYQAFSGTIWGPYDDNFRRRLLMQRIQCRNMGLVE